MRKQGSGKSVLNCAVFVEPLASDGGDGGDKWVKMPRAVGDFESEASVTCSRRVTGGKCIEALGDVDIEAVDVELLQFHCSSKVVVPGDMVGDQ